MAPGAIDWGLGATGVIAAGGGPRGRASGRATLRTRGQATPAREGRRWRAREQAVFSALEERDFRLLWVGAASGFLGFFMSVVVQAVVAFQLTGENIAVGWVVFGRGLAMALLGPIGGAMTDRISKRAILLTSQAVTSVVFAVMAVLMGTGEMTVTYLVLGGFLVGTSFAFVGPARQAYAVELVPEAKRGNAVAINQVALNATRVVGPAVAGWLLAHRFGATGAFVLMAGLYAFAIVCHAMLPRYQHTGPVSERGVLADIAEGLRYVNSRPHLRSLVLYYVLVIMLGFPYVTVLPGLVEHVLHRDAQAVSVLFTTSAAGGLVAALAVTPLADSRRAIAVHLSAGAGFALSLLGLAHVETMFEANVAVIAIGVSTGVVSTLNGAVLLRATERRYFGRVMSLAMMAFAGFGLVGLPIGLLADVYGERWCLRLMGVAVFLVVVVLGPVIARTEPAR